MNPDLTVTNASASPQIQNPKSKIENVMGVSSGHKRNGKIAQLPKAVRDKVNQWIDDGHTYPQIIKDLGDDAKDLKPRHFSEWRKGGYQDYVHHQQWRDELRFLREKGSEMTEFSDSPKFQETLLQVALTEIFRVLQQRELKSDSLNYIRLFNALARLNREALGLRKYNDLLAKQQADLKQLDINREISENEHVAIVDRTDRIFEMPRPHRADGSAARAASSISSERSAVRAANDSPSTIEQPVSSIKQPASAPCPIKNRKSKIENSSSPLPSRPCRAETPDSAQQTRASSASLSASGGEGQGEVAPSPSSVPSIENQKSKIKNPLSEHCLECHASLPPVPRHSLRRPEDHCPNPNCGMRLPDIGLCYKPGFDHCLSCGATQPALLPGGERPRPHCHKCGERLHNPEPTA